MLLRTLALVSLGALPAHDVHLSALSPAAGTPFPSLGPAPDAMPALFGQDDDQDEDEAELTGDEEDPPTEMEIALRMRSLDPGDPVALERLSDLHGVDEDVDSQTAFLLLAIDAVDKAEFDSAGEKKAKLKELRRELDDLDAGLKSIRKARDSYLSDLTWSLRLYTGNQGKLRSALALGERILDFRPDHPIATDVVRQLLKKLDPKLREEAERLLWQKDLQRPRAFLAEYDEAHRAWDDAGTFESERYIVRTNAGYDVGQIASRSLAAIARYFEEFYGVDRSLISVKTVVLLMRTHDEFKLVADNPITDSPGLQAFISSQVMSSGDDGPNIKSTVYGFDPRDRGNPLDGLWPTLWHEASHEYMTLVTKGKPAPLWVNEGMSSYFEGATFSSRGQIAVGLPAYERLDNLYSMLKRGDHPLLDLTRATGSLTAEQYAAAWGVIYYLRHGRGDDGALLRPESLSNAMERLRGSLITGPGLFENAVLGEQSLEDFEAEWIKAMMALHVAESDRVKRAEDLTALGFKRFEAKDNEGAEALFAEALLRDPECQTAVQGMVDLYKAIWIASRKDDDDAADQVLLWSRRLHASYVESGNEEGMEEALATCTLVDRKGFKKVAKAEEKYRGKLDDVIERLLGDDKPRTAVAIAQLYVDDVLGSDRAGEIATDLRGAGTLELDRPFTAFDGKSFEGLSASPASFTLDEDVIEAKGGRPFPSPLFIERALNNRFRFEGDVRFEDSNVVLALCYSAPEMSITEGFAVRPAAPKDAESPPFGFPPFDFVPHGGVSQLTQRFDAARFGITYALDGESEQMESPIVVDEWHRFVLESDEPGVLRLLIDGEEVATREIPLNASASTVGLLVYGGNLTIAELMAVELDRL